jgi:DNA-binding protein Fis
VCAEEAEEPSSPGELREEVAFFLLHHWLGIHRNTLRRKMEEYGIRAE